MRSRSKQKPVEFDRDDTRRNALIAAAIILLIFATGVGLILMGLNTE